MPIFEINKHKSPSRNNRIYLNYTWQDVVIYSMSNFRQECITMCPFILGYRFMVQSWSKRIFKGST